MRNELPSRSHPAAMSHGNLGKHFGLVWLIATLTHGYPEHVDERTAGMSRQRAAAIYTWINPNLPQIKPSCTLHSHVHINMRRNAFSLVLFLYIYIFLNADSAFWLFDSVSFVRRFVQSISVVLFLLFMHQNVQFIKEMVL